MLFPRHNRVSSGNISLLLSISKKDGSAAGDNHLSSVIIM